MTKYTIIIIIVIISMYTRILLHPGEMILFESARLPHGRQDPLDGESYDNLFLHFRLTS